MKGLASARGSRPGRLSDAREVGGGHPRPKRPSWGFLGAFVAGALMLAGPAWADSGILPDPTITPGAVRTTNIGEICNSGSTRSLRHWSRERDDRVMRSYGLPGGVHPDYEVDHLIALENGGSDDDKNLWPEPRRTIEPTWSAERKDELENRLHALICAGELDPEIAQRAIAEDWVEAFRRYVGEPRGEVTSPRTFRPARRPGWTRQLRRWLGGW